jgi:hypothetical protein
MADSPVIYKRLEPFQIAFIKTRIDTRAEIPAILEQLKGAVGDTICGDPLVIFHNGAVKDGYLVEIACPVTRPAETQQVQTRLLEASPALTMFHYGPHQTIRETILKIYDYLDRHAWTTSLFRREILRVQDFTLPERNITEVQVILHEWDRLLAEGAEKFLGTEARQQLMQGIESITPESSSADYTSWIQGVIARLDSLTSDSGKKCLLISHCAHVFPKERIEHLRTIYEQSEFDDILRAMYEDNFWYEKPVRHANVLYMRKNPFNPDAYAVASSLAQRRKAYCHCSFVHPYLDEIPSKLSPTFCYCGAGWYRQLWEGILGQPVKIEHVETLLNGNDQCTLTITLPLELAGDCLPEG